MSCCSTVFFLDKWDGTRDLGSRLFGVFPRRQRQRDERSLVLAADAEAAALPRDATGKRHRHNIAHLAILVRRHSRLLFLDRVRRITSL